MEGRDLEIGKSMVSSAKGDTSPMMDAWTTGCLRFECVSPKFLYWSPHPQCDSIWRGSLWDVTVFV